MSPQSLSRFQHDLKPDKPQNPKSIKTQTESNLSSCGFRFLFGIEQMLILSLYLHTLSLCGIIMNKLFMVI